MTVCELQTRRREPTRPAQSRQPFKLIDLAFLLPPRCTAGPGCEYDARPKYTRDPRTTKAQARPGSEDTRAKYNSPGSRLQPNAGNSLVKHETSPNECSQESTVSAQRLVRCKVASRCVIIILSNPQSSYRTETTQLNSHTIEWKTHRCVSASKPGTNTTAQE